MGQRIDFVDEPFEIEIRKGVVLHIWPDGTRRAIPIDVFRVNVARSVKALAEFDAGRRVVTLRDHG